MPAWGDFLSVSCVDVGSEDHDSPDRNGLYAATAAAVAEELDLLQRKHGLAAGQIIVGGYSQGAASALQSVLEYPERLGACISLSGWMLPRPCAALRDGNANGAGARYYFFHGKGDFQVSFNCSLHAAKLLSEAGAEVRLTEAPSGHAPGREMLEATSAFFEDVASRLLG